MAMAAWLVERALSGALPGSAAALQAVRLAAAIIAGILVLVASARLLRLEELDEAREMARQLVTRSVRS